MKLPRAAQAVWLRLQALAERRLPSLTRLREPEPLPITLHRRRIYVLPTLFGIVFGLMILLMTVGALNYNNNPALLLTALIGSIAVVSVLVGFRNLDGLSLRAIHAEPCHAGEVLQVELTFAPDRRSRQSVRIEIGSAATVVAGDAVNTIRASLNLPTLQRGLFPLPRIRVWTTWPYGLFRPWSWLNPRVELLVYPRAEAIPAPLPLGAHEAQRTYLHPLGDDFGALRDYRVNDPQRLIAWKASARHDRLLVREPEQLVGEEHVLDFDTLSGLDIEARLQRLTRWVLMAEESRARYTLVLPGVRLGPDHGSTHAQRCLRELALF